MNGTLFLIAAPTNDTRQLWKSDGTAAGTVTVRDFQMGTVSSLTSFAGGVYFAGSDPVNGQELWRSDGTEAGTVLVRNISAGSLSSAPAELVSVGSVLFFSADDGLTGRGLWRTDGTTAGTIPMEGPPSLRPRLVNLSSRARVQTNDNVMIAGFIIGGNAPKKVLVTARGPSLAAAPFNVPNPLADPYLRIYSGQTVIFENDNWMDGANANLIPETQRPKDPKDAALLLTLAPGAYTAMVGGGAASAGVGVAIVEVFVQ